MDKKFKVFSPYDPIKSINNLVKFPTVPTEPLQFIWIYDTSTNDPVYGTDSPGIITAMINYYNLSQKLKPRFVPYTPTDSEATLVAQFKTLIESEKYTYFCHGLTSTDTQILQNVVFSKYIGKVIVLSSYATSPDIVKTDNLLRFASSDKQLIDLLSYYLTKNTYVIVKAGENPLFSVKYADLLGHELQGLGKNVQNYSEDLFNQQISTIVNFLNTTSNVGIFFVGFSNISPSVDALLDNGLVANIQVLTSDASANEILTAQTFAYFQETGTENFLITNFFILDDFYTYIIGLYPNASPYILNNRSEIFSLFYIRYSSLPLQTITASPYIDQRFFSETRENSAGQFSLNTYTGVSTYVPVNVYQQISPTQASYGIVQNI